MQYAKVICMQINDEQAQQFADIYMDEYGADITITEARAAIQDALPLIEILLRPLSHEMLNREKSHQADAAEAAV
jgi:hypothetical protein